MAPGSGSAEDDDEAETLANEQRRSEMGAFPWYYGMVFDKLVVAAKIAFWWLVTIPLIVWAVVRTVLVAVLMFAVLLVPLILTTAIGLLLFLTAVYWTPVISVALTQVAPLIAAAVKIGVFGLNVAWFILIVLVDLWNILIPLFVVIFIYAVHFVLTVVTLIVRQLSPTDLSSLFSELIETASFFADLIVIVFTVIVSVLPQALTLTITVARPLLLFFFQVIVFLFPAVQFIFLTLFKFLPAVFFSVLKLVRIFSNLLRAVPVAGAMLSYTPPSESPRYEHGVAEYFDSMMEKAHGLDWQGAIDSMEAIRAGQDQMPDYSHLPDPFDTSANKRRRRSGGVDLPSSRGSLLKRFKATPQTCENGTDARLFASRSLYYDDTDDTAYTTRQERAHIVGTALLDGVHAVADTAAPLHTHIELMKRTLDSGASVLFGYQSAAHALDDYNRRYGHPMQLLLAHTPDLHDSWLGRAVRASNPDDPYNAGMSFHEWRRAGYPPVQDHPHERTANELLERHRPQIMEHRRKMMRQDADRAAGKRAVVQPPNTGLPSGDVPMPFEMPIVLGADCFRSRPKFILCLPRPSPRRFRAPDLLIPTNLPDAATCPGFIAPPNPDDGTATIAREMFHPWTAIRNSWAYARYLLSAFASAFYFVNQQTISSPWAGWFFDVLTLGDSKDEPLSTAELFCLIPFAWYPFYLAGLVVGAIGVGLPLLWLAISLVIYTTLPLRKTYALISGLLLFYRVSGDRLTVLKTRSSVEVSRQRWLRDRAVMHESEGRMPALPGRGPPNDAVGQYEHLRSLQFDDDTLGISAEVSTEKVFRLHGVVGEVVRHTHRHNDAVARVHGLIEQAHAMGALSRRVQSMNDARVHMTQWMQHGPLMPHTNTLAHTQDMLCNAEAALGHRPITDAVPLAHWEEGGD